MSSTPLRYILCSLIVALLGSLELCAQGRREIVKSKYFEDSLGVEDYSRKSQEHSQKFYDKMVNSDKRFWSWLSGLVITSAPNPDLNSALSEQEYNEEYFEEFRGKEIAQIFIVNANVFGGFYSDKQAKDSIAARLSWTERTVNNLHAPTSERVVRKNLLFSVGDLVNPYTLSINEQFLRSKPYLASAYIFLNHRAEDTQKVDAYVFVRDNWSISMTGQLAGAPYVDLYDRNFMGSGNMLSLRYYANGEFQRQGAQVDYEIDNLWGTFAKAQLSAGVGQTNNALRLELERELILPTDHIWGVRAGYHRENEGMPILDTTDDVYHENWGLHYGFAHEINPRKNIYFYTILNTDYHRFIDSPPVSLSMNPYYSNRFSAMFSVGLARQQYFQGNMIYGYGRTEDIPFGFKAELIGGWEDNHTLGRRWYVGGELRYGSYTNVGYFDLRARAGSYFSYSGMPSQSVFDGELNYFSPLASLGAVHWRQFLFLRLTAGANRLQGERERLYYHSPGISGLSTPVYAMGTRRLMLSSESVFFAPMFFYHFRFAFFLWGDFGWLGDRVNVFKNRFAATTGVGVRIKNERLIFNNIELRFGYLIKGIPDARYNWFHFSNERTFEIDHYTPRPPQPIEFE